MTAPGERISTAADFPNLAVYERAGETGPIYSILFDNLGYEGWERTVAAAIGIPLMMLFAFAGLAMSSQAGQDFGAKGFFIGAGVVAAVVIPFLAALMRPWKSRWAIEVDMGALELRVWRKSALKLRRPITPDMALTVDAHPDAEHARMVRQEERKTALSLPEKQHCLFGWFGAKGAEQVVLVTRAEWPCRNSLYEVRQAILWAIQQEARRVSQPAGGAGAPGSIRPPLD